jgi:DNA-binding NtrC family response regulator
MSERILIVDDDPVQRRLLDNMVRKFGYEPLVAEGGDAAASLLAGPDGSRIDAVILDLVMPDLDGLGVLAKMREAALAIPVIVQTAHGGIDNVVTAMRAGAADFVAKPVGAERLAVSRRAAASALSKAIGPHQAKPRRHALVRTSSPAAHACGLLHRGKPRRRRSRC